MYGSPRGAASLAAAARRAWGPGCLAVVSLLLGAGCDARLRLYIHAGRETLFPGRAYGDALVTQGYAASVPPGRTLPPGEPPRPFVLRHPARPPDWNGILVIGAHRGVGGIRRGPAGENLGTGETELDDLIGWWALDQGFAWGSLDRSGLGAGPDAHRLTEAFARLMFGQIRPRLARDPDFTVLLGYGEGGGLARYAAASAEETFDGVVLVAANLGDPAAAARRRTIRLDLASSRKKSPEAGAAYAAAAGTGAAVASPAPISNVQPFTGLNYIICLVGTFPSRS